MGKWLLAVLFTHAADPRSELVLLDGSPSGARVVAAIDHYPDGSVHGRLLKGTTAVVVAQRGPGDYHGELLLVDGGKVERLCDGVLRISTPLVADGRVFVERGRAGGEANEMRVDDLTVDEWTPKGMRTVWRGRGYTAHLAGAFGSEILIYAPNPSGTPLLAVDRDSRKIRVVARELRAPRDFRVDGERLYFSQLSGRKWTLEAIDLVGGGRERLRSGMDAPEAWIGDFGARVRDQGARETLEVVDHGEVRQIATPADSHIQILGFVR